MITFEAELSVSSLEALIEKLDKYAKSLDEATTDINKAIAERGYDLVMKNVPVLTGELKNSIQSEYNSEYARIYTDNEHAAYAEFGTGVVGKSKPHELADKNGWIYDYKNQGWQGYVGRKYMYHSYITLKQELNGIAKDVLTRKELI